MDTTQLLAIFDQDQRREVEFPDTRREVAAHVVRSIDNNPNGLSMVLWSDLDASNADEVILEQIRYFEGIGHDFEWKLFDHDQPPDLKERLRAHGFEIEESEAIMVLPLAEAPDVLWQPVAQDVRRVTSREKLAEIISIQEQVWGEDFAWIDRFLGEALSKHPKHVSVYVAYHDGEPASAAWAWFPTGSRFCSLWGGSTVSRFRKQGLYTALLAVRAQEARARGVEFMSVDASPMSRPIVAKYGFQQIATSWPCKWTRTTRGEDSSPG